MNFVETKNIHDRLLGTTHIEADRTLLRERDPQHKLLRAINFNPARDASDILMALLNLATEDEIVLNRRQYVAGLPKTDKEEAKAKEAEELANLAEEEAKAKEPEELAKLAEEEAKAKEAKELAKLTKTKPAEKKSSSKSKNTRK